MADDKESEGNHEKTEDKPPKDTGQEDCQNDEQTDSGNYVAKNSVSTSAPAPHADPSLLNTALKAGDACKIKQVGIKAPALTLYSTGGPAVTDIPVSADISSDFRLIIDRTAKKSFRRHLPRKEKILYCSPIKRECIRTNLRPWVQKRP